MNTVILSLSLILLSPSISAADLLDLSISRFSCAIQAATTIVQCTPPPPAGLRNYVGSAHMSNQAATAQTLDIIAGTGVNCAIGTTALTHKFQFGTLALTFNPFIVAPVFRSPLVPPPATAICVRPSAATAYGATITGFVAP